MEYICLCGKNFGNAKKAFREHVRVCTSKPTEFKCSYCGRTFSRKGTCVFHENNCNENPNKPGTASHKGSPGPHRGYRKENGWNCPVCSENFRTRRLLEEHKKQHRIENGGKRRAVIINCNCQFCSRSFTRICFKTRHEKYCKQNPNAIHCVGHKHSEDSKRKISERRKTYIDKHPNEIPFVMYQHQKHKSYAEQYFMDWLLKENIYDKDEYRVSRYQLDFAWPEKMVYLEVDGNYHKTLKAQQHDLERTKNLALLGWTCIARIDWSQYQSMLQSEKEQFLASLKEHIKTAKKNIN